MPEQAINATLDLDGLEVIGVAAFGDVIELVMSPVSTLGPVAAAAVSLQNPRSVPKSWCATWR